MIKDRTRKSGEGNAQIEFPHFDVMDSVLGDCPSVSPTDVFESSESYKQGEAQLHMEEVEGTYNLYRPSIGTNSVWYESIETLIWPIFVTFDGDSMGYRLRHTAQEIAEQAM